MINHKEYEIKCSIKEMSDKIAKMERYLSKDIHNKRLHTFSEMMGLTYDFLEFCKPPKYPSNKNISQII